MDTCYICEKILPKDYDDTACPECIKDLCDLCDLWDGIEEED